MRQSTDCHCGGSDHDAGCSCGQVALERPRYFPRQLLTPVELTLEQQYFRDRLRRHNRLLHGWGVVCGGAVCALPGEPDPKTNQTRPQRWKVRVQPGYVLGPYGDEILLDCEQVVDLRTVGLTADGCGDPVDPWCSDVFVKRDQGPLYVAVRYAEVQTRPVRVQPVGCGCDDAQCEFSRLRDGYEIGILTACPQSHQEPPNRDDLFKGGIPGCPPCPAEPWVVLAQVDLDADGNITGIDNCSCRRLAAGFGPFWWQCTGDPCAEERVKVEPVPLPPPPEPAEPATPPAPEDVETKQPPAGRGRKGNK